MRIAMHGVRDLTDEQAQYIRQLGVTDINLNQHWQSLPGDFIAYDDLCRLREKMEGHGFRVAVLENIPIHFYDKIMLGLPGREQQMDNLRTTIGNIGRSGIPIFGFHFMPTSVWRTNLPLEDDGVERKIPVFDPKKATPYFDGGSHAQQPIPRVARGGAAVSTFDYRLVKDAPACHPACPGRIFGEDEMWDNFTYFIRGIMPIADEVGLKISMHPDDPLVPSLGGIARPFIDLSAFKRATEIADSPLFGVTFCLGNWTLMGLEQMRDGLRHFADSGRLHYVHFQAVTGTAERFQETFFDESDVFPEVVRFLSDIDYEGVLVPGHAPVMRETVGPFEDPWKQDLLGLTHSVGYLQGLLRGILG